LANSSSFARNQNICLPVRSGTSCKQKLGDLVIELGTGMHFANQFFLRVGRVNLVSRCRSL